mmetsp:Transcript_8336/g.10303  ORF Transcript_8336/g.10303 Transcript_8336/m.10303 type:complete len:98 (+) Transcript_8336:191-484(+)
MFFLFFPWWKVEGILVDRDGDVWCFGSDKNGALALDGEVLQHHRNIHWRTLRWFLAELNILLVWIPGVLWTFGNNEFGQLGVASHNIVWHWKNTKLN